MQAYLTRAKIELTAACNHACTFCYNPERSNVILPDAVPSKKVTFETLREVIDRAIDYGIESFTFIGGEPLLRRDLLFPALTHVSRRNRVSTMVSNLSLCKESDAKELKQRGVRGLMTSFHSSDEAQFNAVVGVPRLEQVVRGIKYIRAERIPLKANVVVLRDNLQSLYRTFMYLVEIGVHAIDVTPMSPTTQEHISLMLTRDELQFVFDTALDVRQQTGIPISTQRPFPHCALPIDEKYAVFKRSCHVEDDEITLTAGGDFKICGTDHHIQGNVLRRSIADLVRMSGDASFVRRDTMKECHSCTQYEVCRGGCPTEELVLKQARRAHPYRDVTHPITKMPVMKRTVVPRLLHESITFDLSTRFTQEGDLWYMCAYDQTIPLSKQEYAVVSELIRGVVGMKLLPWEIAIKEGLDKNVLNTFVGYLRKRGVVQINTVPEETLCSQMTYQ